MDWYTSLQTTIDLFFRYLPLIDMLAFLAIVILIFKKMMPKSRGKKRGFF